jgi:hypothetical protein
MNMRNHVLNRATWERNRGLLRLGTVIAGIFASNPMQSKMLEK